ncbi:MAG TPA: APC family permease [Pseudolysinimonas sp.]|nr:APC family permease [Pseudolysinimonas sp.]
MTALARRLGLTDAIAIGLGSMLGAGVFAAFAPAAGAAGSGLLIGLGLAGLVAYGNAASSAQLAARYPTSGGAYASGRAVLGAWPGYLAGWSFVVGKTASCAAMAATAAAYLAPEGWQKPVAVAAILALTGLNLLGVTRTALVTKVLVVLVLCALTVAVVTSSATATPAPLGPLATDPYGVLQSAGLLFFAFAGYARIATMGEEVRDPARTIPRAILIALAGALVIYAVVAVSLLTALGPDRLAASTAPLADAAAHAGTWTGPVVRAGAAIAALGALLALIAGVGRTALAMGRTGDLPRWFAGVSSRQVPHHAELALAAAVCVLVLVTDLRGVIGFSSFGVLLYYLVANLAALRQPPGERRYPRAVPVLGAAGCLVLVATLPPESIVGGVIVLAAGVALRVLRRRLS